MQYALDPVSMDFLRNKIDLTTPYPRHLHCLNRHKTVHEFSILPCSNSEITFRNALGGTFQLKIQFFTLTYSSSMKHSESCVTPEEKKTGPIVYVRHRGIPLIGFTINDIVKYHYKTTAEKEKKEVEEAKVNPDDEFKESKLETKLMSQTIKKIAQKTEVSDGNVLGYIDSAGSILSWDLLISHRAIKAKSKAKASTSGPKNLEAFTSQYLCFPAYCLITQPTKQKNVVSAPMIYDVTISTRLARMFSSGVINHLVGYFLFGKSLNPRLDQASKIHKFDPPMLLTDILLKFSKTDSHCQYLEVYKKIVKKRNTNEEKLASEMKEYTLDKMPEKIRRSFYNSQPMWSLRKIRLRTWCENRDFVQVSDHGNLWRKKSNRMKFLDSKAEKKIPDHIAYDKSYPYHGDRRRRGEDKIARGWVKSNLRDFNAWGKFSDNFSDTLEIN